MVTGRPIEASARWIATVASLSDWPSARLNEMVVAGWVSWWLTEVGVEESAQLANDESGTSDSLVPETATPVDAARAGGALGPATATAAVAAPAAGAPVTAPNPPVPAA